MTAETNTELVKSLSIDTLLSQREVILKRIEHAITLLKEAQQIAERAHIDIPAFSLKTPGRIERRIVGRYVDESTELMDSIYRDIDTSAWRHLMNESGVHTFMNAKARSEWDKTLDEGRYPVLSKENITATFSSLHAAREEMFERSLLEVFRGLSWDRETQQPFKLGKRVIVDWLVSTWGRRNEYIHFINPGIDNLDNLVRVFCVLDDKSEPDYSRCMYSCLSKANSCGMREWNGPYFSIRWYKKGTGRLTFTRPDLVDKMNRILVKHYPNALAANHR